MKIQLRRSELNKFWFTAVAVVFSLCLFVVLSYTGYTETVNNVIAIASVLISFYLCFVYRYNIGLLIVMLMIFYTNYSVAVGVYLDPSIRPAHLFNQFSNVDNYGTTIMCVYIFELFLLILSSKVIKSPQMLDKEPLKEQIQCENNSLIAYGAVIIYCVMFFMGFEFSSGKSGRALVTSISEYKIIIQIIGMYYTGNKKQFKYIWTVIVGLTSIFTFIGGNRIDALSNIIALIIFEYSNFLNYKKILLALPIGVVFFAGIGYMRTGFSFSSAAIKETISVLTEDKLTYEGAVFAWLPTLTVAEITGKISSSEKLAILIEHIKDMFYIFSVDEEKSNLIIFSQNFKLHYGGFISPAYFYFWFGYIGAVIFSVLINWYISIYTKYLKMKPTGFAQKLLHILSIFFVSCVGRWYCYGPEYLFKSIVVCGVIYSVVYAFDNIINRNSQRKQN